MCSRRKAKLWCAKPKAWRELHNKGNRVTASEMERRGDDQAWRKRLNEFKAARLTCLGCGGKDAVFCRLSQIP